MRIYYVITHVKHLITQMKFDEYVVHQLLFKRLNSRFFFPQNLVILMQFFHKNPLDESNWISFGDQGMKISPQNNHYTSPIGFLLVTKWLKFSAPKNKSIG
jgi:hypothetical protein